MWSRTAARSSGAPKTSRFAASSLARWRSRPRARRPRTCIAVKWPYPPSAAARSCSADALAPSISIRGSPAACVAIRIYLRCSYRRDMDDKLLNEYLLRIGVERPGSADAPALRSLHRAHQMTAPFDHLALVVRPADGSGRWLADVGFGSHSTFPLLFESRQDQDDPAGLFLLADAEDGDVDVLKDGEPQYRLERRERLLA